MTAKKRKKKWVEPLTVPAVGWYRVVFIGGKKKAPSGFKAASYLLRHDAVREANVWTAKGFPAKVLWTAKRVLLGGHEVYRCKLPRPVVPPMRVVIPVPDACDA